jgi:hypothetical protein
MGCFDGSSESVVRRVEIIVGGVGGFCFGVAMGVVAAGLWRLAAFCVQSLNESDLREGAVTGVTGRGQQEPRNRVRIGGIGSRRNFAHDLAAIVVLPGRTREVFRDHFILRVKKLCVGRFESPREFLVETRLADVNLIAGSVRLQDKFFRRGWRELVGNFGARELLRGRWLHGEQNEERGEE